MKNMYLRRKAVLLLILIIVGTLATLLLYTGSISRYLLPSTDIFWMLRNTGKADALHSPLKTTSNSPKLVLIYTPLFGSPIWRDIPPDYKFTGSDRYMNFSSFEDAPLVIVYLDQFLKIFWWFFREGWINSPNRSKIKMSRRFLNKISCIIQKTN